LAADRRVIALRAATPRGAPTAGVPVSPPLALYVHYPWCVRKCPYCDFNSHEARGDIPEEAYVDALIADLEHALPQVWGRRAGSVFIGGGTPSLLAPASVERLLAAVRARLKLLPGAEITLEANPGTVEATRFAAYRDAGVNRLSLGIQSFDDTRLAALGRIHDARQACAAIETALRHFDNVNLDLMYALPGQTLDDARRDLDVALSYRPAHLCAYHLTLEPNTPFHRSPPPLPDPDLAADMQDMVEASLAEGGYGHYETSAFSLPGRHCRHNLNYWQFGDYLGIGAGAHGKLSSHAEIRREMRHRHPAAYLAAVAAGTPVQESCTVSAAELPFEFLMNALRLTAGFTPALYAERTGLTLAEIQEMLDQAERRGLLAVTAERIAATGRGRRFLNDLLEIFLTG
jgi:oxygen-independent coproporphyrinogen-3 oxidase